MCNSLKYGLLLDRFKVLSLRKLKQHREGLSKKLGYKWFLLGKNHCKSILCICRSEIYEYSCIYCTVRCIPVQ